jgi:type I restriction enzyme M protein
MVDGDVVDCMIALPPQLFYSTQIPACLWFLARNKNPGGKWRDRRGQVLFIDARNLGHMVDRTRRELSESDIEKIAGTYHSWRGEPKAGDYTDIPGFCTSASTEAIKVGNYVLTPGRYVGAAAAEDDNSPFAQRFAELSSKLERQFAESDQLTATIREKLREVEINE